MNLRQFCCKRSWARRISARALSLGLAGVLCAPVALQAAVPEWLKALARAPLPPVDGETPALTLLNEQRTTVKDNGDIETSYRRAVRILRPEGRSEGTVVVHFDSETRLTFLKGWTISARGVEFEVRERDAVETSPFGNTLYEDTRLKVLKLPAVEVGSVIGYEYTQKRRPMLFQDEWHFQEELPVATARYLVQLPAGWEFRPFWLNFAPQEARSGPSHQAVWEINNVPAIKREPAMPSWQALAGRVAVSFQPLDPAMRKKAHASWSDVGAWAERLTAGRRQASPEIRQKVAELTAGLPDALEQIRALTSFVQREIRYVAIEIGIGGYQPYPAAQVFAGRYGDCKDKATLLGSMLAEIGVASYPVLIHTRRGVVAPDFPSALSFNHMILAIRIPDGVEETSLFAGMNHPRLGRLLFFDPTHPLTPLGYLPPALQANRGLIVTGDGGELVEIPLLPPNVNRLLRSARLALSADGLLSGEVSEIRWGAPATSVRAALVDAPQADRAKVLEGYFAQHLGGLVFEGCKDENLEKIDASLILRCRFLARNYAQQAGDLLLVRPKVLGQSASDLLEREERKHPLEFPTTTLESDIFEITLPPGYQVDELPPSVQVETSFAAYQSRVEVSGGVLKYTRQFVLKDVVVSGERLGELRTLYRQIAADERSNAVLKRAAP